MNKPQSTVDRLYHVVSSVFGVPSTAIDEQTSAESLATWDSVGHMQLMMAVESEFGVDLPLDAVIELSDVQSIRSLLQTKGVDV